MVTTFCTLLPKMPQWKFSGPSGFLSRSPSSASKDLSASVKSGSLAEAGAVTVPSSASGSGLAAVLSACEPVCATPCSRLRGGTGGGGRKTPRAPGPRASGEEWSRKGSFISKPVQGWLHPDERVLGPGVSYIVRVSSLLSFPLPNEAAELPWFGGGQCLGSFNVCLGFCRFWGVGLPHLACGSA